MKLKHIIAWVLTVGLSGALVEPLKDLFGLIPWTKFIDLATYSWLVKPVLHISVLHIILFVIILVVALKLLYLIILKLEEKRSEELLANKMAQLKSFNQLTFEDNPTVQVRWKVAEPGMYNAHFHSYNVELFCLNHPTPLMMPDCHCPDYSCKNSGNYIDLSAVKNQIDSMIIENARELGLEQ